jgi:NADPH-dependent ferric siderophore reductase
MRLDVVGYTSGTEADSLPPSGRTRREPPRFRRVAVRRAERVSPRLVRITLGGDELAGLAIEHPASSVRLLLPSPGADELLIPTWSGNEFRLPDGSRPAIRTLTPWRVDHMEHELDVGVVIHGEGVASQWAASEPVGASAAISGPGRGYQVDEDAPAFLIGGDETAIPAMTQVLAAVPASAAAQVHVEISSPDAQIAFDGHANATVTWHERAEDARPGDALLAAVKDGELAPDARVWIAGEAAAVQRIRKHLFEERGVPRPHATIRGYWKHGRSAEGDEG